MGLIQSTCDSSSAIIDDADGSGFLIKKPNEIVFTIALWNILNVFRFHLGLQPFAM
jgi:hypothetical protein